MQIAPPRSIDDINKNYWLVLATYYDYVMLTKFFFTDIITILVAVKNINIVLVYLNYELYKLPVSNFVINFCSLQQLFTGIQV